VGTLRQAGENRVVEQITALTVIVPTTGRPTLERTLRSFAGDLGGDDEIVVMSDGDHPHIEFLVSQLAKEYPAPVWTFAWEHPQGNWGHPLRNMALDKFVDTTHVWTIDDDDIAAPGAINTIRGYLMHDFVIFRMHFGPGHPADGVTCWRYQQVMHGDIGTPMVVARKCAARYGLHYSGDYDYAHELQAQYGEPVWAPETIAIIRPEATDAAL